MSSAPKHVPLPKSERHVVSGAVAIGPAAPDEVIEVTVNVRRRQPLPSVDSMATQLPCHRKYLTRKQFEHTYGADQKDLELVAAFAKEYGLKVMESSVAKHQVRLQGTVQAFSKAFLVTLERYQHSGGTYRGRKGTLSIPENLAGVVVGVFGLDNRRMARNYLRRSRAVEQAGPKTFTPPQVAQLYDYPTLGSGTNQCIGILEFGGGFTDSDNQTFFSGLNLPVPTIVAVPVGNGRNDPGADTDADGEVALDIQVAGSIAPQARLAVYFSEFTEQGWVDPVSTAVNDSQNKPSVLSISWGFSEFGKIPNQLEWTQQAMDAVDESFQAAAVMGVTICCAAGGRWLRRPGERWPCPC